MIATSKETMVRETKSRQPRPDSSPRHEDADHASTDLLVVLDGAGSIREISPSVTHLLAHRRGQLLGTSFLEILHPDDVAVVTSLLAGMTQVADELAQVHLRTGDHLLAEEQARHALELLADREDMLDEVGNARLVLGRALLEQGRLDEAGEALAEAEQAFDRLASVSHRAAAWVAQGDLAARRDDERRAAALYRRAAEALQDFRF